MWPLNRKKSNRSFGPLRNAVLPAATPDRPQSFGYKTTWWAIKSEDSKAVVATIGLSDPMPCNWATGIPISYQNGIFVAPPIDGWTLVTGLQLPPVGSDPDKECLHSLLSLSRKFGDVQLFSTHRVVGYNVWARAIAGELIRGFGYLGESGEIFWNDGDDSTELDLGWNFEEFDSIDEDKFDPDYEEVHYPTEQHVMEIAGEWSISPVELQQYEILGTGWIGSNSDL